MATVAHLDVKIGADIKSFQAGMSKLQNQMSQVGQNLRNVGRTMSLAVTAPIVGIGAAAVKAASDVEEMQSKFDTVFKTVGGDVRKEVNAFASAVGRSRFELQGMTAELGDIFKPLGFTEERAGDLAIQMTKLAVDLGSFNNMPMNEALERLRGTLVGSHENALRFGVVINENVLKQELARMGADKLTGAQKEQAKVQARLNLLLAGTTDAQGDALRTSDSFANQMERLKNNLRDTGATIGQLLLPHALKMVQMLNGAVSFVRDLSPQMQRLGIIIAGVAAAAGPLVFSLGGIASAFSSILRVLTLTMGLFNPWVAGIAAAAAIGVVLYQNWGSVQEVFESIGLTIKNTFGPALESLKGVITTWVGDVVDLGAAIFGSIVTWWGENGASLLSLLGRVFTSIGSVFTAGLDAVIRIVETGLDAVMRFWAEHGEAIVIGMGYALKQVLLTLENTMESIAALIRAGMAVAKADWKTAGEELLSVVTLQWDGIVESAENAKTAFLDATATKASEFSDKFEVEGFRDVVQLALDKTGLSFLDLKKAAEEHLDIGADEFDERFGSRDFEKIVAMALSSTATNVEDFRTEALLALQEGDLNESFGADEFKTKASGAISSITGVVSEMVRRATEGLSEFKQSVQENVAGDDGVEGAFEDATEAIGECVAELDTKLEPAFRRVKWNKWEEDIKDLADSAWRLSSNLSGIYDAIRLLYNEKVPKWMERSFFYAQGFTTMVEALESITDLISIEFWKDFGTQLWDIAKAFGDIALKIGDAVVKLIEWGLAQIGIGGGGPATGGSGGAGGVVSTGAGLAGGSGLGSTLGWGGVVGAATVGAGLLGIGAFGSVMNWLGGFTGSTLESNGFDPTTYGGGNLAGAFGGTLGSGVTGLNFGSGWLSGAQFGGGAGRMAQTINVVLDGQTIATSSLPYMAQELELRGTNY